MFQIAENFGLTHLSQGEGESRHIVIQKKDISTNKTPTMGEENSRTSSLPPKQNETRGAKASQNYSNSCNDELEIEENGSDSNGMVKCQNCGHMTTTANLTLHELRCQGKQQSAVTSESTRSSAKQKKTKKKKESKENAVKIFSKTKAEDFDELIAMATKLNTRCNFEKCKESITVLGQKCRFCAMTFCLSHHIPEVHGCGREAKGQARQLISKEGVLYHGSGVPNKLPSADKKAALQRKLDSKLNKMADERKNKKKS